MTRLPRPAGNVGPSALSSEPGGIAGAGSVEALYPFLYEGAVDAGKVIAEARQSTVAKTREIIDLRAEVCDKNGERLIACAKAMAAKFAAGGRLLTFGNGGSATDAQEVAALFSYPQASETSLPAIGLASDVSVLTALANDVGVDVVFARQIAAFGRRTDIAFGLSTSGNSENLLRAFDTARQIGLLTVGVSGYNGGKMAEVGRLDYLFVAPSTSIHRIQEAQTTIYHVLWELVVTELEESRAST